MITKIFTKIQPRNNMRLLDFNKEIPENVDYDGRDLSIEDLQLQTLADFDKDFKYNDLSAMIWGTVTYKFLRYIQNYKELQIYTNANETKLYIYVNMIELLYNELYTPFVFINIKPEIITRKNDRYLVEFVVSIEVDYIHHYIKKNKNLLLRKAKLLQLKKTMKQNEFLAILDAST